MSNIFSCGDFSYITLTDTGKKAEIVEIRSQIYVINQAIQKKSTWHHYLAASCDL